MQRYKSSRFVGYELHPPDEAASSGWYSRLFGWTAEDVTVLGRSYLTLRAGSIAIRGILPKSTASFEL